MIFSFVNTAFRAVVNFCTVLLLAGLLGPEDFGRFSFLVATFIALKQFLDMASSEAFFKYVSERPRSKTFIKVYTAWIGLQLGIVVLFIGLLFPESLLAKFWAGEQRLIILFAFMAMFLRETVWLNVANLSESFRLTTYNQTAQTIVVLSHLLILVSLWLFDSLAIEFVFIASVVEWTIASIWMFTIINKHQAVKGSVFELESEPLDTVKSVISEFWEYCKFLIPYAWVGFIVDFTSRWMLQTWGSAEEQAYFSVGQQFAAISILVASSVLKIFWKEIAEAHHNKDFQRMELFYTKTSYFLYFIASISAAILLPWTDEIILLFLGDAYEGASLTMKLMFLYPLHQTIGFVTGSVLYATGHVKLQVTLGMIFSAVSLASGFYLMAPDTIWRHGLDLGSEGLAIRFVVLNVIFVNVWAFMICRLFEWKFKWFYQFMVMVLTLICSYTVKNITTMFLSEHDLIAMLVSTTLYLCVLAFIIYLYPGVTGFTRTQLLDFYQKTVSRRSD